MKSKTIKRISNKCKKYKISKIIQIFAPNKIKKIIEKKNKLSLKKINIL